MHYSNAKLFRPRPASWRRGATTLELAIVLLVFLMLTLGMLDLGLAVFRSHVLSHAARQGTRQAMVRGEFADRLGKLGPAAFSGTAADNQAVADALRPHLVTMDPSDVMLQVEWPDGSNEVKDRVKVTLSAEYAPVTTFLFGNPSWTLRSSSTVTIAH